MQVNDDNKEEEVKDTSREKQISSFCLQAISTMSLNFDPKLIPLFDCKDFDLSVQEWIKKVELICQLNGLKCIECVVPMHLSGGVYAVYQ